MFLDRAYVRYVWSKELPPSFQPTVMRCCRRRKVSRYSYEQALIDLYVSFDGLSSRPGFILLVRQSAASIEIDNVKKNTHVVADVHHWVGIDLEQLANSRAILHRHKQRFPSGSITALMRLSCLCNKLALLDHRVHSASLLWLDTCSCDDQ